MQDAYGRPLSDDGQWVWDGAGWRPTAGGEPEPTTVAPRDFGLSGGQPAYGRPAPYGEGPYGEGPYGGHGPEGEGPYGGPLPPVPFLKRPWVVPTIIGSLLVISAVLVTVLLLLRGGGDNSPKLLPSQSLVPTVVPTTVEPTTQAPTDTPSTEVPTTEPATPTPPASTTIAQGVYECTSGGSLFGTVTIAGNAYVTDSPSTGTYTYDEATSDISFNGGDLSPYTGTYDPSGPSLELTAPGGTALHCAQ